VALVWTDQDRERSFDRVSRAIAPLPDTRAAAWGSHLRLTVRDKGFGYAMADHHGDGRLAVTCRAPLGAQQALVAAEPDRYFVPAYTGRNGWIGAYLDDDHAPDWDEVAGLLRQAWEMTAPRALRRELATDG
jgi:hypothetical protein